LHDGVTGRLVPARDVDGMARALLDDFRNPAAASERGRRARREIELRFSLDAMVTAYADVYGRLLAQTAGRGRLNQRS